MEKTTTAPNGLSLPTLVSKKTGKLINRFLPSWSNSQIDGKLFIPSTQDPRKMRLPRGFAQFAIKSASGKVQVYHTGKGPTVLFVHGWGGQAQQFFPLMHGLAQCGFHAVAYDQLGHGLSERKPGTLPQMVETLNEVLTHVRRNPNDGLTSLVGHSTGCIAIANARPALVKDAGLFLISPVFNYKLYFLKKLVKLDLHPDLVKQYAHRFGREYRGKYMKYELARKLERYADVAVIAHDECDRDSAVIDSAKFCARFPLTRLLVTRNFDHERVINCESVWQELKSHLNYDDTSIHFTAEVIYQ